MSDVDRCFSAAFYEPEFDRMKESPHVTVIDYTPMGSMPEQDYYVSFRVNRSVDTDTDR
jgi:hypothetical protein